ncbi:acyltransferase family protein [Demequina lignilytica]|uniref:Acyltransferase family protein n=1 Tax=Demequina lignilytica TaxID=3051663 RepID=A0AB35MIM0_9MICO|nr:acyltransferase family protein [Demequina sp. SYSU T0a273]MDN4483528.1 acyltransferase family protein [Demequina sp. SYSU T0a273]
MSEESGKRRDLQALRFLAVGVVVAYHIAPGFIPGGYVGVDVFFVLSGFLITAALLREIERSGRVRILAFWARRARRLLPASLVVIAATLIAAYVWMPVTQWVNTARHAGASSLYIENWLLSFDAVDYSAAENAATPLQHFWSLSVEEQFYLVWPILLLIAGLAAARRIWAARAIIGAVLLLSLVLSIVLTGANPAGAYFFTHTRAWEFAAGALLATVPALRLADRTRSALAWAGIVAVLVATMTFTGATPFPGSAALLPVAGAALVIVARPSDAWHSPMALGRLAPIQRIGDTSYSVYLWHWPIIIILPFAWPGSSGLQQGIVTLALTVLMAELSYRLVENPVRSARFLTTRGPALTIGLTVAASALVVGGAALLQVDAQRQAEETRLAAPDSPELAQCRGAQAVFSADGCAEYSDAVVVPAPVAAPEDRPATCMQQQDVAEVRVCESGAPLEDATEVVALIGDSHTMHWIPAVRVVAEAAGWHVVEVLKGSCPFTDAVRLTSEENSTSCTAWNAGVHGYLAEHPEITRIFTSASAMNPYVPLEADAPDAVGDAVEAALSSRPASRDISAEQAEAGVVGYLSAWERLPDNIAHVYALRDIARPQPDVVDCMATLDAAQLAEGARDCAIETDESLLADPVEIAAGIAGERVEVVDLATPLCSEDLCRPVIGAVAIYRDGHHMTRTFSLTLGPELGRRIGIDGIPAPDLSQQ